MQDVGRMAFCPHQWRPSFLRETIEVNPSLYLDEMLQKLSDIWEVDARLMLLLLQFREHHCLAQAHITWLFLETFWFSQNYAKDCKMCMSGIRRLRHLRPSGSTAWCQAFPSYSDIFRHFVDYLQSIILFYSNYSRVDRKRATTKYQLM